MKLQVKVLSGARAGLTAVFSGATISVGRHPESVFQFDPERDLDVSTRHASFRHEGTSWFVRDVGSRNGTHVNGHRIQTETKLDDTDQIRFGTDGPRIEIRLVSDGTPDQAPPPVPVSQRPHRATDAVPSLPDTGSGVVRGLPGTASGVVETAPREPVRHAERSTTERIRVEVGKQTKSLRWLVGALSVVLIGVVGFFVWDNFQREQRRQADIAAMRARMDSIIAASELAITSLEGRNEGLADALQTSRGDVQRLQTELSAATDDAEVENLRQRLATATAAFEYQQTAATVDYAAIFEANQFAIAMITVDFGGNRIESGTAFAVNPSGRMVTNRHVVTGEDGSLTPRRIAIQFHNSSQVVRANLVAVDQDVDLAVVQVQGIRGTVAPVQGLAAQSATAAVGDPVAMIGFPLGDDIPMRSPGESNIVRSTFTAGTVSKVLPDLVQVDGYGAPGASGSPVFDRDGNVIAVLYGAEAGSNGRIIYSVPVQRLRELLQQLN